jgi:hypothetical protein
MKSSKPPLMVVLINPESAEMKRYLPVLIIFIGFFVCSSFIDPPKKNKSICWEISGNGLKQPSYLFGTFHLLNDSYLLRISKWKNKFKHSKSVMVEMVVDSSKLMGIMSKMISKDTTLDQLLSKEEYQLTADYLKDIGYDISQFNTFKPMSLSILITTQIWAKLKPGDYNPSQLPMDMYFERLGKKQEKSAATGAPSTRQRLAW